MLMLIKWSYEFSNWVVVGEHEKMNQITPTCLMPKNFSGHWFKGYETKDYTCTSVNVKERRSHKRGNGERGTGPRWHGLDRLSPLNPEPSTSVNPLEGLLRRVLLLQEELPSSLETRTNSMTIIKNHHSSETMERETTWLLKNHLNQNSHGFFSFSVSSPGPCSIRSIFWQQQRGLKEGATLHCTTETGF